VCKGGVPIEEIVCGGGFALVEKILNSYICVAWISYALVYHMDLWTLNIYKSAWHVCYYCDFLVKQLIRAKRVKTWSKEPKAPR
jgi:hypothetical protein